MTSKQVVTNSNRTRNTTQEYHANEMWHYGPYKLVPLPKGRVALPGRTIVTVAELYDMAAKRGFKIKEPIEVHEL